MTSLTASETPKPPSTPEEKVFKNISHKIGKQNCFRTQNQSPDTVAIEIPQSSHELLTAISLLASLKLLRKVRLHQHLAPKQPIQIQPNVGQDDAAWHLCWKLRAKWTEPNKVRRYVLPGPSNPFEKLSFQLFFFSQRDPKDARH